MFDPNTQLAKGQEVHVTGLVEYNSQAFATLKTANGEFSIHLDTHGKEMARLLDGKDVEMRGKLTGEFYNTLISTLTSPSGGSLETGGRTPEIQVIDFEVVATFIVDNTDGTITDTKTGLMWQKDDDGNEKTWEEASMYAKSLMLAGHDDWRLPSKEELNTLWRNAGRKIEQRKEYFPSMKFYWSSTPGKDAAGMEVLSFDPNTHDFSPLPKILPTTFVAFATESEWRRQTLLHRPFERQAKSGEPWDTKGDRHVN